MHKSDKKFSSFNKISKLTSKIRALHIPIMNLPNIYGFKHILLNSSQSNFILQQIINQMGCEKSITVKEQSLSIIQSNYKSLNELTERILRQLRENEQTYGNFIPYSQIQKMLNDFSLRFYGHQSSKELIALIIDFLSYCKNQSGGEPILPTTFTQKFTKELAMKWQKVREPVYFANKGHLRLLSFIVKHPQSQWSYYGAHFQQFKMDLAQQSCEKLAAIGLEMCRQNTGSFAYLTNYLWGSCLNLYHNGASIGEIQANYIKILGILCGKYRPAPQIFGKNDQLDIHSLKKRQDLIPKIQIDLRDKADKDQFLNDCIMERAEEAIKQYDEFYKFIYQICKKNDGFHFKSGLKIKERSETKALLRIKEKMLKDIYTEYQLEQTMGESKQRSNSKQSLSEMVEDERKKYEQKMRDIYDNLKEPLYFKVSDMLRGKCAFSVVEKINKCCTDIKEAIENGKYKHLKLIEIDNRLRMGTSDLVLKILFGNVIAEMQLVIDLSASDYAFAHKLYELQRSQFFTPLTQLFIMNESLSNNYFTEAKAYLNGNRLNEKEDYEQATTFKEASKVFDAFVKSLPSTVDTNRLFEGSADVSLMNEEINLFNSLLKANISGNTAVKSKWEIKYTEGDYCFEMKEYEKGRTILKEALSEAKRQYEESPSQEMKKLIKLGESKIFFKLGDIQRYAGQDKEALAYYKDCLSIQERLKGDVIIDTTQTLNNIGLVYSDQCDFANAFQYYKQSLQIEEKVKGKGSINSASTLGYIGIVYKSQGNYPKALEYYKQSLQIKERFKGKGSIDTASTLNNIGLIYYSQGDYPKAMEYFKQSLQIVEKAKGKGSIGTASTLGNIGSVYSNQGDYPKALDYYKQCLQIEKRVKGKGNIDTAPTLGNIGSLYFDQGDFVNALDYYTQSLQIQERVKGKGSIDTASTLGNIGNIYKDQGDYNKALEYYKQSLQIQEKVKGKGNISTASTLNNIGLVYYGQGDYPKALDYYEQSLQIEEKVRGKGSIGSASTLGNIGSVYTDQGDYSKAFQVYKQALQIEERVKGKGSIDTASTLGNIGSAYSDKGDYPIALEYYQKCLQIEERVKGKGNIDTASTLNNIGLVYSNLGDYSKALEYYKQSLQIQQRVKGKGSIDTAFSHNFTGNAYKQQGDYLSASLHFQESLSIFKRCGRPQAKNVMSHLSQCYEALNEEQKLQQLIKEYNQTVQLYEQNLLQFYCINNSIQSIFMMTVLHNQQQIIIRRYHRHLTAHHLRLLNLKGFIIYMRTQFCIYSFGICLVISDASSDEGKSFILIVFTTILMIYLFRL